MKTYKRATGDVNAVQFKEGSEIEGVVQMPFESGSPECGLWKSPEVSIVLNPGDWLVFDGDNVYALPDSTFREMYKVPEEKDGEPSFTTKAGDLVSVSVAESGAVEDVVPVDEDGDPNPHGHTKKKKG